MDKTLKNPGVRYFPASLEGPLASHSCVAGHAVLARRLPRPSPRPHQPDSEILNKMRVVPVVVVARAGKLKRGGFGGDLVDLSVGELGWGAIC